MLYFKKEKEAAVVTAEMIHADFYDEANKAVEEARKIIDDKDGSLLDKSNRLSKLGFHSSKDVLNAHQVRQRTETSRLLLDYLVRYPNYKFITEIKVKKICSKYKLVMGSVSNFIGEVPEKNLREIEAFKMHEQDQYVSQYYGEQSGYWGSSNGVSPISPQYMALPSTPSRYTPALMICAPHKDFNNVSTKVVDGYKLVPKDPVVLQPIKGGYLILTAWGAEASDELVVNEIKN